MHRVVFSNSGFDYTGKTYRFEHLCTRNVVLILRYPYSGQYPNDRDYDH